KAAIFVRTEPELIVRRAIDGEGETIEAAGRGLDAHWVAGVYQLELVRAGVVEHAEKAGDADIEQLHDAERGTGVSIAREIEAAQARADDAAVGCGVAALLAATVVDHARAGRDAGVSVAHVVLIASAGVARRLVRAGRMRIARARV